MVFFFSFPICPESTDSNFSDRNSACSWVVDFGLLINRQRDCSLLSCVWIYCAPISRVTIWLGSPRTPYKHIQNTTKPDSGVLGKENIHAREMTGESPYIVRNTEYIGSTRPHVGTFSSFLTRLLASSFSLI